MSGRASMHDILDGARLHMQDGTEHACTLTTRQRCTQAAMTFDLRVARRRGRMQAWCAACDQNALSCAATRTLDIVLRAAAHLIAAHVQ